MIIENSNSLEHSASIFLEIIADELNAWKELKKTLSEEFNILLNKELNSLSDITNKKESHCEALEHQNQIREDFLNQLSLNNDKSGIDTFLLTLPIANQDKIRPVWQQIQDTASECKKANEVNGHIIERSQKTTHWLLNLLRGKTLTPKLYGSDGNERNGGETLHLASA